MGIEDLPLDDEELIAQNTLTIADLKDMFGREAARRGLEYMQSLSRADENFRDTAESDKMTEGYRKAGVHGPVEPASDEWEKAMEEEGLGLDDE